MQRLPTFIKIDVVPVLPFNTSCLRYEKSHVSGVFIFLHPSLILVPKLQYFISNMILVNLVNLVNGS